jgi:hypothetical protein
MRKWLICFYFSSMARLMHEKGAGSRHPQGVTEMNYLLRAAAVVAALAAPILASAHAISIGYTNAGPGAVTVWLGTYGHGGHHLEGSMKLEGVLGNPFPATTIPFSILTSTGVGFKPAGLIDGTTNFYTDWNGVIPNNLPLVGSEAPFNAGCPACGPVNHWQGATFSGLAAGSYQFTYVPIANPSAEWDLASINMNGIFDLTGVVNQTPEPMSLALLGTGLALLGIARRRPRLQA